MKTVSLFQMFGYCISSSLVGYGGLFQEDGTTDLWKHSRSASFRRKLLPKSGKRQHGDDFSHSAE